MRNLKRTLSLALAALMLMSMMVVSAGAATKDFTDSSEIQNKEAVEVMVALNVISGKDDGSYFAPNDTLTREEMAKVVSYVMNGGVEPVVGTKVNPTYSDIKGIWSEKYIEYCTSMGIINGDGAGKFNPTGTLTAEQAAKMFLTAMGYNANVFGFTGNSWAINVGRYANEAGLYKNLGDVVPSQPISRDDACQMAYNAIQGTMMKRTWSQDLTTGQLTETYVPWTTEDNNGVSYPVTLLGQKFDGVIKLGYLEDFSYDSTKKQWTYEFQGDGNPFGGSAIDATDKIENGGGTKSLKSDVDYTGFFGQQVKVIYNTKDNEVIYGVYANESSVVVEGATGNVEDYNDTADTVTVSGTDYKLNGNANTITVYNFGDYTTTTTLDTLKANATGTNLSAYTFKMLDNTGDGKIDAVIRTPMTVAKINYVGKDSVQFGSGVATQKLDDLVTYDGFAAGDWVCFIYGVNSVYGDNTIQKLELQTSAVSGVRGGATANVYTEYQINDAWMAASGNATYAGMIAKADVNDTIEYVSLGSTVFYAKIVDIAATTKNIAMVVTADNTTGGNNVHGTNVEAKLLLADGTTKTVNISKVTTHDGSGNAIVKDSTLGLGDVTALIGTLVTYRVDGSDYELTAVGNYNLAGYKTFRTQTTIGATAYNNGKVDGIELADDAVVYFIANDGASSPTDSSDNGAFIPAAGRKSDVYTGKEIKNTWGTGTKTIATGAGAGSGQTQDTDTVDKVYVLTQEINGFTYAKVVLIADETALPKVTTGSNYGYLSAPTSRTVEDGKTYLNYTIHTANGELKVKEENTDAANLYPKGAVITYDVVSDGIVKNVNLVKSGMITGKVTGWDGVDKIALDGFSTEIDANDTTIIYVDSDKMVGAEGGSIQKFADYNGDGIANGIEPDNVRYVLSSSKDYVVFLLVDINNEMKANPVAMSLSGDVDQADIESALTNGSADLNASGLTAAVTVNVANGQTLNVTNVSTSYKLTVHVANGATLRLAAAPSDRTKLEINVQPGGSVVLSDGTQLLGASSAAVQSGTVKVEADAYSVYAISADADVKVVNNTTVKNTTYFNFTSTAKLTGNSNVTITFGTNGQTISGSNFYNDATDATADSVVTSATYKWTTFTETGTNTQVTGWLKQ